MALKRAEIKAAAPAAPKSSVPVVDVRGVRITEYNKQEQLVKDAEALLKELRPEVEQKALQQLVDHNVQFPHNTIDSIKLRDDNGSVVRFSFTSKYKIADGANAEAVCESLGIDINQYAQETAKVSFDNDVFLDKEGNFDPAVYDAFKKAVDDVAKKLNKVSPLTSKLVVLPKPHFHAKRWTEFADREKQLSLCKAFPNTCQLVANAKV